MIMAKKRLADLKWFGDEMFAEVKGNSKKAVIRANSSVKKEIIKLISRKQPVRRLASGRIVGLKPSTPGTPPKIVTRDLIKSIKSEYWEDGKKVIGAVGSDDTDKALALEFGTSDVKPRPFIRRAFANKLTEIKKILGAK